MKIVIMGLRNYDNYGDQLLPVVVEYLVKKVDNNIETRIESFLDLDGKGYEEFKERRSKIVKMKDGKLKYFLIYSNMKNYCFDRYVEIFKEADAVIISSGSYKYGTQHLWATYSIIVEAAQKVNIPVMFNGMNIQVYNKKDWRCRLLSKYSGQNNVIVFSTRDGSDGIGLLKNYYLRDDNIETYAVGDSAFWTKECYNPVGSKTDIIGINLIREGIFTDYGGSLSDDRLYQIYEELIIGLEKRGYKWELFSNGMKVDYNFGVTLLKKMGMPEKIENIVVPKDDVAYVNNLLRYKAIIGARLHACIVAYSLGIPFSGYIWDKKIWYFADQSKILDRFCREDNLTSEEMINKMELSINNDVDEDVKLDLKTKTYKAIERFIEKISN